MAASPQLIAALKSPAFAGMNAATALAAGEGVGTPLENSSLQTIAAVVKVIGEDNARIVCATLAASGQTDPLINAFQQKLYSYGQEWNDPAWQSNITKLGNQAGWNPETITTPLLEMGIKPQTVWQNLGIDPAPTVGDVADALSQIAEQQRITNFMNNFWNAAVGSGTATVSELQALAADPSKWS